MMYGRITIDQQHPKNPKVKPNLEIILENRTILRWYFSQIKIVGKESIDQMIKYRYLDVSHPKYDREILLEHLQKNLSKIRGSIVVDFLLDQELFPGVGNILQQEALYRCSIFPTRKVLNLNRTDIECLVDQVHSAAMELYKIQKENRPYQDIRKILKIYHRAYCPLGHKTVTKILGDRERRTTWCPICQL